LKSAPAGQTPLDVVLKDAYARVKSTARSFSRKRDDLLEK
jgi:hypothetical protein